MIPYGSLVNAGAIIAGGLIGCMLRSHFPERIRRIVFQGLGLCVVLIGLQMAFKAENLIVVTFAILLGGITGELMGLKELFERIGNRFKRAVRSKDENFTDGLVTSSLIFCIGAMAIVGSLEEGLRGDPTVLFNKAILDGFASVALAATFGPGVIFSFIPVLLYQGGMTLGAGAAQQYFTPAMINQLTATGGLLILGIGINLLELTEIKLPSLLPALAYAVVLTLLFT